MRNGRCIFRLVAAATALLLPSLAGIVPAARGVAADELPRVLLLGDSISIGYTPYVQQMLRDEAVVIRPMRSETAAENCSGTTYGGEHVERWLKLGGGRWDVIHFNFGLHDLKRVDPQSGAPSDNPQHPRQAELDKYEAQLRTIVEKLQATGATLIFATTTPVPEGRVRPHRDVEDPPRYNEAALRVMKQYKVAINDLYGFALPRLEQIQHPVNVHFTPEGSRVLAEQVVRHIREALRQRSKAP
jgi:lysophospholipase L1-like esterase